ncbi:MAG: C39 family peptidase, partial [Planctomycetaceae bacterium]|nr:C39 family peptidase [Planctomycetaceae bacterium]
MWKFASPLLLIPGLLGVIWSSAVSQDNRLESIQIPNVPHIQQKPDFCGEACVAMALNRLGRNVDQDWVFDHAGLDPHLGRGCYTRDLAKAVKAIGFDPGPIWYTVAANRSRSELDSQFRQLHRDLKRGVPSIVCMHYNDRPNTTEHFRLIVGYSQSDDEV